MECILFSLDPCTDVQCGIPGETCLEGSCKCGKLESCVKYEIDRSNPFYDYLKGNVSCAASDSSCLCNDIRTEMLTVCSKEKKFCTHDGCKCSKTQDTYTGGDNISQGTCMLASDRCLSENGNCDGK